jgi:hypothetical protein
MEFMGTLACGDESLGGRSILATVSIDSSRSVTHPASERALLEMSRRLSNQICYEPNARLV